MASLDELSTVRLHLATLYRAGLGRRLIDCFGSAREVFRRPSRELTEVGGMTRAVLARLTSASSGRAAESELERCAREGVSVWIQGSSAYPTVLDGLPDMPLVLFARGCLESSDALAVGIVGSRRASPYGTRQARRFATELARVGITLVSGLARGIDGVAQEASVDAGGRTIAVLGSGLGRIYPPEHRPLATRIAAEHGALLTEFPFESAPRSFHFPQRNRLLSGLSRALVIVEAGRRSGSIITADWALRQGRSIFVVPGRVDHPEAIGALELLRDGATPALEPRDVVEALGVRVVAPETGSDTGRPTPGAAQKPEGSIPGPLGAKLERLFREEDRWHPEILLSHLGAPPSEVLSELARLEVEGYLTRDLAGAWVLAR